MIASGHDSNHYIIMVLGDKRQQKEDRPKDNSSTSNLLISKAITYIENYINLVILETCLFITHILEAIREK